MVLFRMKWLFTLFFWNIMIHMISINFIMIIAVMVNYVWYMISQNNPAIDLFWTSWFFFTTGNVFVCGKLDDLCVTCSVAKPETYPEFDSSGRLVAQVIRVRWYVWWSVFFRMKDVLVQSTRHFFISMMDGWVPFFPNIKRCDWK